MTVEYENKDQANFDNLQDLTELSNKIREIEEEGRKSIEKLESELSEIRKHVSNQEQNVI